MVMTDTKIIVTACSYCNRIRNHNSEWVALTETGKKVMDSVKIELSHTYCPNCTDENLSSKLSPIFADKMKVIAQNERDRENSGYYSRSLSDDQLSVLNLLTVLENLNV